MPVAAPVARAPPDRAHDLVDKPLAFPFPEEPCRARPAEARPAEARPAEARPAEAREPYGLFVVLAVRHVSGARVMPYAPRWGFGNGSPRNEAGSCVNLHALWTPRKFALLREHCPHMDVMECHELFVHVEAWAGPGLLNFALRAACEDRIAELHDEDHMRKRLALSGLEPLVDVRLPVDPSDWWKHPMFASTPPKQCA